MKVFRFGIPGLSVIGKVGVFGLLILPIAGNAEPPIDAPSAPSTHAEVNANGPVASPEPDWPQWNGPRRDGISREKGLLPTWPEDGPRLIWKIGTLGRGWSSPIIVHDRLYITGDVEDDMVILAFDLDGKPLWQAQNGRSWTGSYPGARACCAYSEGKLYHMNAHGRVVCLEADTGKQRWAVDVLERFQGRNITWAMSECLLVDGSRVIVTPGGDKALMAALDKESGRTVWTTEPLHEDRASHSSPLLFRHVGRRIIANCSSAHGFGVVGRRTAQGSGQSGPRVLQEDRPGCTVSGSPQPNKTQDVRHDLQSRRCWYPRRERGWNMRIIASANP